MRKKITQFIHKQCQDLFYRHKKIFIGMPENVMLETMNYRSDKISEENKTTYRFVFLSRGGSGESSGFITSTQNINNNISGIYGSSYGYSEQHDESSVTIECKNSKVTKISPYNMNNIMIPTDYRMLLRFADNLGIDYTNE